MVDDNRLRSLLVGIAVDEEHAQNPALNYAMDLARAYRSRLTVYVFAPALLQPFPLTLGSSSVWIAQETDRIEELSGQTSQTVRQLASQAGLSVVVEHAHSPFDGRYQRFIDLARLHDLTILQAALSSGSGDRTAVEHALFDTGRPVLVTPQKNFAVPKRVAVGWDGSARAARAVRDSLDFLIGTDQVTIATVIDTKGSQGLRSADGLAAYLAQYGIRTTVCVIAEEQGGDEGHPLRQFVAREQIELLVMGAFVHSRLRQAILGGMTRSLLDACPIPIIMAY
jgi:nucleotide-binding universal stress UspA family protein